MKPNPVLSQCDNIIVIADECHRTKYGLITGFANNLCKALLNAWFIGFTGTPIDSKDADTAAVFREIMHTYDNKPATVDKAVVPTFYEPRLAKLHLGNEQIEEEVEEITFGIGDKLRDATKKYTSSGGSGQVTIDMEEAFDLALAVISDLQQQLPDGFSYAECPTLSKGNQIKLVYAASNFFVKDDDVCKTFMLNEKKLSSLVPVIKNHERVREIALEIIFFQHVGAAVRKVKFPTTNIRVKGEKIKELIHRSIESEEVVDMFQMAGIDRFDISIINDDFLATAKEKKSGNELKLELIRQILNDEIKVRASKNMVKSRRLKEEVEKIISDYHNHFFDSLIALQKLRDVAREMQEEDQRRQQLGLTEEEEAFYEILSKHPNAVQDFELIKAIVKDVTAIIKKNAKQPDWYKKSDTKAQILLSLKSILRRKGVTEELQEILSEIMEQAEARYKEWAFEVA